MLDPAWIYQQMAGLNRSVDDHHHRIEEHHRRLEQQTSDHGALKDKLVKLEELAARLKSWAQLGLVLIVVFLNLGREATLDLVKALLAGGLK